MGEKRKAQPVMLSPASLEKVRDAAFWTEGETISSLMERGALELVARLEAERGEPFPPRTGDVARHRPKRIPPPPS